MKSRLHVYNVFTYLTVCVCARAQKVGFVPDGKHVQSVQWSHLGGANTYENFDWESMIITPTPEEENHQFCELHVYV